MKRFSWNSSNLSLSTIFSLDPLDLKLLGLIKKLVICERLSGSTIIIKSLLKISPLRFPFFSRNFEYSYSVLTQSIFWDRLQSSSVTKDFKARSSALINALLSSILTNSGKLGSAVKYEFIKLQSWTK